MKRFAYLLLFAVLSLCGMVGCGADSTLNLKSKVSTSHRGIITSSQAALALVEANFADKLNNRLGRIEEHLGQYIRPTDAPQAVSFGVDHDKIAALAPYTPDALQQLPHIEDLLGKRLGDLYYEQEIVRRQLALLTGRNRLPGHADGIEQYKTLLASGAEYLKRFGLSPGVALNAEQMANLTTDVVILVNRTVTLADGTTREVAMPQLYVHKRAGDTDGRRTLIAGEGITGQANKVQNSAVLHAREYNTLQASHVDNTGRITARDQHLSSTGDIHNIGGLIQGGRSVNVRAGGKVVNDSTTQSHGVGSDHTAYSHSQTGENKTGRILLDSEGRLEDQGGSLLVYGAGGVESNGADIENRNAGSLTYIGGQYVRFGTVSLQKDMTNNSVALYGRDGNFIILNGESRGEKLLSNTIGKEFNFSTTTFINVKKELNEKVLGVWSINQIEDLGYNFQGMDLYMDQVASRYNREVSEGRNHDEAYRIATNTSIPGSTFAQTHEKVTGFISSTAQVSAKFAIDAAKFSLDFLILDDLKTIMNPQSPKDFIISAASIIPIAKPLKALKLRNKTDKANDIRKAVNDSQKARESSKFSIHIEKEKNIQENIQKRIDNPNIGIEELMKNSTRRKDTKGRAIQFDRFEKGFNQANIDFDFLKPNNIRAFEKNGITGRLGTLNDGRNINVRERGTEGLPSLEIQNEKNSFKFRY